MNTVRQTLPEYRASAEISLYGIAETSPRRLLFLLLLAVCLLLFACGSNKRPNQPELLPLPYDLPVDPPHGSYMLTANTYAGDVLASMLLQRTGETSAILVTNLVRLDTLDDNTSFGMLAAQQIASRVAQHGFMIIDVRLNRDLLINSKGEFMLSRDLARTLIRDYNAHAVLVGTYTYSTDKIFVTTRAIRLADNAVIAAYEYYLPLTGDTKYLLSGNRGVPDSSGSAMQRYSARGQAFDCPQQSHYKTPAPAVQEKDAPYIAPSAPSAATSESRSPVASSSAVAQPGAVTPLGREYIAPARPPAGSPLPERIDVMNGGQRIDPGSRPIGSGARQR